eukprot:12915371-Prorocentrum_lima.AAC.1
MMPATSLWSCVHPAAVSVALSASGSLERGCGAGAACLRGCGSPGGDGGALLCGPSLGRAGAPAGAQAAPAGGLQ